jgi:hypothetical protein
MLVSMLKERRPLSVPLSILAPHAGVVAVALCVAAVCRRPPLTHAREAAVAFYFYATAAARPYAVVAAAARTAVTAACPTLG